MAVHEAAALAMTPHRGPTFLDFPLDVFGPSAGEVPDVGVARVRGARSGRGRRARRAGRRRRAAGVHRRQRRLLGRRVGRVALRRSSTCACRASSTVWAAARCPPTTSWRSCARAGCSSSAPTWSSCWARRSTSGSASVGSATRRSRTSSTARRSAPAHVEVPTVAGDLGASCGPSPTAPAASGRSRAVDRRAARRRGGRAVRPSAAARADGDPIKPSRIYGELGQRLAATRSSSATAATSQSTPASSSRCSSPGAGSTPARTAASATAWAMRSRPGSLGRAARSCCCSATAPRASA